MTDPSIDTARTPYDDLQPSPNPTQGYLGPLCPDGALAVCGRPVGRPVAWVSIHTHYTAKGQEWRSALQLPKEE